MQAECDGLNSNRFSIRAAFLVNEHCGSIRRGYTFIPLPSAFRCIAPPPDPYYS